LLYTHVVPLIPINQLAKCSPSPSLSPSFYQSQRSQTHKSHSPSTLCPHTVLVLLAVVVVLFKLVVVVVLLVAFVLELVVDVVFALLAVVVTDVPLFLTVKIAISCNASVALTLVPVPLALV
jgi:uncharacterized membrane protein